MLLRKTASTNAIDAAVLSVHRFGIIIASQTRSTPASFAATASSIGDERRI